MTDRKNLLGAAVLGLSLIVPASKSFAAPAATPFEWSAATCGEEHDEKDGEHEEKKDKGKEHDEEHDEEHGEEKEIEQAVPMAMVPQAILDAVKKEVPNGTITEAELVAKKHKITYTFDVKAGDTVYDVEVSVDGKFISKSVDDESDEKPEADKKPDAAAKK